MVATSKDLQAMKKMMKNLMLVAAAAMGFTACQSGLDEITMRPTEPEKVTISIVASEAEESRTAINEDAQSFVWSEGDQIKVIENSTAADSDAASINNGLATFTVTMDAVTDVTSFTYNAIYPISAWATSNNTNVEKMKLIIPSTQKPAVDSFDPKADLLIAKPITRTSQATSLNMEFKRMVAIGKMSLTLPADATSISEVEFTAIGDGETDKVVAGRNYVNLTTGAVVQEGYYGATNTLTLSYDEAVATTTPVFFTCNPFELAAGEKFSITVTCDNAIYTREVTIPADRSLLFTAGDLTTFSVSLTTEDTTIEQIDTTVYYYTQITSLADLTDGEYIIAGLGFDGSTYYALPSNTTISSNKINGVALTLTDGVVLPTDATDKVWTINKGSDGYTIYNGSKYLYYNSSTNIGVRADEYTWSVSYNQTGWEFASETDGRGLIFQATDNGTDVRNRFGGYANSNYESSGYARIQLFKKLAEGEETTKDPIITTDITSKSIDVDGIEDFYITVTATNFNVNNITVESDVEWITVEHEGDGNVLTNVAANDTDTVREGHITISYDTASAVVTYIQSANAKKVSVAEFLAAAEDDTLYELSGTIVNVDNTTYGNFYIMDDTGTVYIYGLYSPEGAEKYWAESGAQLGDDIVVRTVRTSHNDTPQGKNAIFVSLTSPGTQVFWTFDNTSVTLNAADGSKAAVNVSLYNTTEIPVCTSDNDQFTATYEDGTITITAEENTSTTETITGTITVTCGNLTESITVTQNAASTGDVTLLTDILNKAFTGVSTSYTEWSGKSGSASSAVYAGQSSGGNESIQLRSNNSNSGIVTTTTGGKVRKVVVTWNSNTTADRTLDIYGSNTAYTSPTELYDTSTQGTKLGSIVCGTSTELEITGDYAYIGLRSNYGAMYLDEIQISWEN